jgi:hypothetical protein
VAQTFLSAGSGDFPVARLVTFNAPIQEQCQDAPFIISPNKIHCRFLASRLPYPRF